MEVPAVYPLNIFFVPISLLFVDIVVVFFCRLEVFFKSTRLPCQFFLIYFFRSVRRKVRRAIQVELGKTDAEMETDPELSMQNLMHFDPDAEGGDFKVVLQEVRKASFWDIGQIGTQRHPPMVVAATAASAAAAGNADEPVSHQITFSATSEFIANPATNAGVEFGV